MHPGAFEFVQQFATTDQVRVIEIGSRIINGTIRDHFPAADWIGLDLYPGPGVDVVCDAVNYKPDNLANVVICAEVLEHAENWREILHRAEQWLIPGSRIIVTCGGPDREPHSAIDGGPLRVGEHYGNLSQDQLAEELHYAGFVSIEVSGNEHWRDTYGTAKKT